MILQETVLVTLNSFTVKYYENLGYSIPRYKNKWGRLVWKEGTELKVKILDLPKNSETKVLCKCDECGKERELVFRLYRKLCKVCAGNTKDHLEKISGKNHHSWNHSISEEERNTLKKRSIPGYNRAMKMAKKRDGKCLICGLTKNLRGHHIKDFHNHINLRVDENNIVTLCVNHHTGKHGIHTIYGRFPTEENWKEYKNSFFK